MKETSRRKFGKQITGALAALLVAAIAMENRASAQDQNKLTPRVSSPQEITTSHNTPPALTIGEGSLNIESSQEFTPPPMGGSGPFKYKGSGMPSIGHIRVLQDNGDKLYEDIESETRAVRIVWEDDDQNPGGGELTIANENQVFVITSDKRLQLPGNSPAAAHRRFKYGHPGNPNKRMRIKSVDITNSLGMTTTFTAPPRSPGGEFIPHEFRVLIWRH